MNDRTKIGLRILAVAALMGLLGDALLRETPWGINVLVWAAVLVAAVRVLLSRRMELTAGGRWLGLATVGFAALIAWRDSPTLKTLDGLGLAGALSLTALHSRSGRVLLAGITDYAQGFFITSYNAAFGTPLLLFDDIQWGEIPARNRPSQLAAAGRGLLIAFPLLAVFGGLFIAADAAFATLVQNAFRFNFDRILVHGLVTAVCTWSVGGSLRAILLDKWEEPDSPSVDSTTVAVRPKEPQNRISLGIVELGIVLGLLDLLFFSFVIVQFRYFFGGASTVEATTGLTYAVYARHGFFELVAVAVLVLPMLLGAHWLLRTDNLRHEWIFRVLAGTQLVLLFVIMISALQRMRLYQNEYGLTELRLYTTAFMGWLAIVFIWFAATVLRGKRQQFAFGAVVSAAVLIGTLHLLNPDALIVKANTARAGSGRGFDAIYASSLSADAVPSLVAALPALNPKDRQIVAAGLLSRWTLLEHADWRSESWSRRYALLAVRQNHATLWNNAEWAEISQSPPSPVSRGDSR
jgi:Domain of unknown function (DUF4153)